MSGKFYLFIGIILGIILYQYVYLAYEARFQTILDELRHWTRVKYQELHDGQRTD